jgi:predicted Zn-dependent protease
LQVLLTQRPDDIRAMQALMEVYVASGQANAGIQQLKSMAARQPAFAPMQTLLATWLRRAGDYAGAAAAARAAAAADPSAIAPRLMLAELDIVGKHLDAARQTLDSLQAAQKAKPEVQMLYSALEQESGDYARSIEHLRAVIAAAPQSVAALNNLAYLLVDYANQPDEGLQYAQRVKELAPEDMRVEDTIGWAFFSKGLYPSAIAHLQRAAAHDSNAAVPRYHLAMAYHRSGDAVRARQALADATKLDPNAHERKRATELISTATTH